MRFSSTLSEHATFEPSSVPKISSVARRNGSAPKENPADELSYSVLIVDRDAMSSHLLASALIRESRCRAIPVRSSELIQHLAGNPVDLVIIGAAVNYRSGDGFDLEELVCRQHPKLRTVMLLDEADRRCVVRAFRAGARGVFSRERPISEFLDCVERVRRGFIWAGTQESQYLLDAFRSVPMPALQDIVSYPELTERELQVVQCAAKGKTNKAIATELGLSEHTVKNYLFRSFEKLGVSSRVELLFYLTQRGQRGVDREAKADTNHNEEERAP